jgi:PTS system ascorbate-specific IIA component
MTAVLIIAHAPLASSLCAAAAHTYPNLSAQVAALDVGPEDTPEKIEGQARECIDALGQDDVLILVDVFGATPCNALRSLADPAHVRVLAGVNVPMLWRTLCYLKDPRETLETLAERALAGGRQGVMAVSVSPPQNQPPKSGHDPDHHHHQ